MYLYRACIRRVIYSICNVYIYPDTPKDYRQGLLIRYIACYYVVAMCYIWRTGSYGTVNNFPVLQTQ